MENATKALLMAGGVLIAIIIITLLVKIYGNIGAFQRQQLSLEEAERIEQFNKDYTKYDGQYVYGTEVITVINRSANSDSDITIEIIFKGEYEYKKGKRTIRVKSGDEIELKTSDDKYAFINGNLKNGDVSESFGGTTIEEDTSTEIVTGLKIRAFKCEVTGYDSTGRVNKIKFTEKMYNGGETISE